MEDYQIKKMKKSFIASAFVALQVTALELTMSCEIRVATI